MNYTIKHQPEKENEKVIEYENIKRVAIRKLLGGDFLNHGISIGLFDEDDKLIKGFKVSNIAELYYNEDRLLPEENEINTPDTPTVGQDYEALYKDALNKINEKIILIESYKMVIRDLLGREKR